MILNQDVVFYKSSCRRINKIGKYLQYIKKKKADYKIICEVCFQWCEK